MRQKKKARNRMKVMVLTVLAVVAVFMIGASVIDSASATETKTLENVRILHIVDQKDTAYSDITFDDGTGQLYALVVHDIYIEKEEIFIGEVYDVKYIEHQFMRPDNFIEAMID